MSHFSVLGFDYFRAGPDIWIRFRTTWQAGLHLDGRWRTFSERELGRKGPWTVRVGGKAEVSACRLRHLA